MTTSSEAPSQINKPTGAAAKPTQKTSAGPSGAALKKKRRSAILKACKAEGGQSLEDLQQALNEKTQNKGPMRRMINGMVKKNLLWETAEDGQTKFHAHAKTRLPKEARKRKYRKRANAADTKKASFL